jgi:hypothetical protein
MALLPPFPPFLAEDNRGQDEAGGSTVEREVARLLDELAHRVAGAEGGAEQAVAVSVVADLEVRAALRPGRPHDPWVVVARRFAAAHRAVLCLPASPEIVQRLDQHLAALDDPAGVMLAAWLERQEAERTTLATALLPPEEPAPEPGEQVLR